MVKLTKKFRIDLINKFNKIKEVFDINKYNRIPIPSKMPINHYLTIRMIENYNFELISDTKLIMLCGIFDFVFCAGDYGYTEEQNLAINELNDLIFELKS